MLYGYVNKKGVLLKVEDLLSGIAFKNKRETSTQPGDKFAFNSLVRPYDMDIIDRLADSSVWVSSACEILAKDVMGNGYEILTYDSENENNETIKKEIEDWLIKNNVEDLFYRFCYDYKLYGEAVIEIAGESIGTSIYHIPSRYTFVQKDLIEDDSLLKLTMYNQNVLYAPYKCQNPEYEDLNQYIRCINYNKEDRNYGRPSVVDISEAIIGNLFVRQYNNDFFRNYGMPAGVITVSGDIDPGEIDENGKSDFDKAIEEQVRGFAENPHSVMVLYANSRSPEGKVEIKVEPLSSPTEGSFSQFKKDNDDEIIAGLRIPAYLYGINEVGSLGGDNSKQSIENYKRHELQPVKKIVENILNRLIKDIWGNECNYYFWLKDLDTKDKNQDIDYAIKVLEKGGMKLGDFVNMYGKEFGTSSEDLKDLAGFVMINGQLVNPEDFNKDLEENDKKSIWNVFK